MSEWPAIDFGHTAFESAFGRGDVYAVAPDPTRMGKRPLDIAIAGAGGVAQAKWIPAIRHLQMLGEPVRLAAVTDPRPDAVDKAARLGGAKAFADVSMLLAAQRPDLLIVTTADAAHAPVATAALQSGVACLIEKPLSRDYREAQALVRLADEASVLLAAVANKRFSPPYAMAKALIERGALKAAPTVFSGKFTLGYPYVDLLEGGTVHLLDLARWLMGDVVRLHARGIARDEGGVLSAVVSLAFASGAIGTLVTSAAALSFKPWERVEIIGHHAFLVVDDQFETTLFDEETGPAKSWRPAIPNTLMFDEAFGGYVGLLDNVLDAVRGITPLAATAKDGAAAIGLIEAIRRSLAEARDIDIVAEGLSP
ncbi:MAG: Gfo/Idh/MocA family oxidoreductase [Ancalomicrobiaceae bacterium]|nr:Gfo/Idh/MocA family oxidoreductase [Ancalomicrobiaceae bacterium]